MQCGGRVRVTHVNVVVAVVDIVESLLRKEVQSAADSTRTTTATGSRPAAAATTTTCHRGFSASSNFSDASSCVSHRQARLY